MQIERDRDLNERREAVESGDDKENGDDVVELAEIRVARGAHVTAVGETHEEEKKRDDHRVDRVDQRVLKERAARAQLFLGEHDGAQDVEQKAETRD